MTKNKQKKHARNKLNADALAYNLMLEHSLANPPRQSKWSRFMEWCNNMLMLLLLLIILIILFIPLMLINLICWIEYRIKRKSPNEQFELLN